MRVCVHVHTCGPVRATVLIPLLSESQRFRSSRWLRPPGCCGTYGRNFLPKAARQSAAVMFPSNMQMYAVMRDKPRNGWRHYWAAEDSPCRRGGGPRAASRSAVFSSLIRAGGLNCFTLFTASHSTSGRRKCAREEVMSLRTSWCLCNTAG